MLWVGGVSRPTEEDHKELSRFSASGSNNNHVCLFLLGSLHNGIPRPTAYHQASHIELQLSVRQTDSETAGTDFLVEGRGTPSLPQCWAADSMTASALSLNSVLALLRASPEQTALMPHAQFTCGRKERAPARRTRSSSSMSEAA